jgi:hypothetical protein
MSYLKGLIIWLVYSLLIVAIFWVVIGPEFTSFNKLDNVIREIQKITEFRAGESYRKIYSQLEMLEKMSSYSSGNQNFAEVARHFMPLIYMIGFIEVLVKNIFVFFLIPLIWGLRSSFSRAHIFLITFVSFYLLIIFYTYVERDFIQTRFLLTPTILLFPWIGFGIQKIFSKVKASTQPKLILAICVFLFVFMPLGKFAKTMAGEESSICQAGEWIKKDPRLQNVTFYTDDSRIGFHAGRTREHYEKVVRKYKEKKEKKGLALEQFAIENKIDLIALKITKKKIKSAPKFEKYTKLKEFKGKKKIVFIYCSPALCKKLDM